MIKLIQKMIFKHRYKKEVEKAITRARATGRKHFVILFKGKPVAITKQRVAHMVRTNKFKKGTTVQEIEKLALFVTSPKFKA